MWLSEDDLFRLTGYSRPSSQRRWLESHGWTHEVDGNGKPIVLRSYAENRWNPSAPVVVDSPLVIDYSAIR